MQERAEALIAAAAGVELAREAHPAEEAKDRFAHRPGEWVSAEALYERLEEAVQHGASGEVAMLAWVQLWIDDDGESFEIGAGVVEVAASGDLKWNESLRWTDPGLRWLSERGIDTAALSAAPEVGPEL